MKKLIIFIAICIATLSACSDPITSGNVIEKRYIPAHNESYLRQQYAGQTCRTSTVNKLSTTSCTPNYIYVTDERFVPDNWDIKIRACGAEAKVDDNSCREDWIDVDETTYNNYEIGQHYPDPR